MPGARWAQRGVPMLAPAVPGRNLAEPLAADEAAR